MRPSPSTDGPYRIHPHTRTWATEAELQIIEEALSRVASDETAPPEVEAQHARLDLEWSRHSE